MKVLDFEKKDIILLEELLPVVSSAYLNKHIELRGIGLFVFLLDTDEIFRDWINISDNPTIITKYLVNLFARIHSSESQSWGGGAYKLKTSTQVFKFIN